MVLKIRRIHLWNAIMLLVLMIHNCISTSATRQIMDEALGRENATADSQDQQVASQYYRPYYYNRRPAYPSRPNYRPTYVNNQRPAYNSVPYNYRPGTTRRPSVSNNNNACSSSTAIDSNQGNWICWDPTNQKLRMGPSLTIEKFVLFYSQLASGPIDMNVAFRQQLCEQSKRFNRVGIICVYYRSISSTESEGDCPSNANQHPAVCSSDSSVCVCISDQYYHIASQNPSPYLSSDLNWLSVFNSFYGR